MHPPGSGAALAQPCPAVAPQHVERQRCQDGGQEKNRNEPAQVGVPETRDVGGHGNGGGGGGGCGSGWHLGGGRLREARLKKNGEIGEC